MDKLMQYRELVKRHLMGLAALVKSQPLPGVETDCVFDEDRDHYLLLNVGWSKRRRVRGITLHVRLRDGKIWVEEDLTEDGIATVLVKAGVPKQDIVLGFQPPEMRPLTEFAVA
jgi:hypothetical protein